jgi:dihydrofolate reductase
MTSLKYSTSMSLDGFVAGVDQSRENPLGVNGMLLHEWLRVLAVWRKEAGVGGDGETNASTRVIEEEDANVGAIIMGRNMFGGGPGPWGEHPWNGWWGDDPPYHLPVFVLTHHARPRLEMEGGTSFTFVTEGLGAALDMARHAANGQDVVVSGGASVAKQCIAAGMIDQILIHLVPVFLGAGIRLFDDPALHEVKLTQVRAIEAPGVTHVTYRVVR